MKAPISSDLSLCSRISELQLRWHVLQPVSDLMRHKGIKFMSSRINKLVILTYMLILMLHDNYMMVNLSAKGLPCQNRVVHTYLVGR